jgi:hypothetical protein
MCIMYMMPGPTYDGELNTKRGMQSMCWVPWCMDATTNEAQEQKGASSYASA